MDGKRAGRLPEIWFWGAVVISVALVAATMATIYLNLNGGIAAFVLSKFNLAHENNVAAWWSGMVLALAGIHALDGFAAHRNQDARVARGWLALALVLFILSMDEIASVHERVSLIGEALADNSWVLLAPFAVVLMVMTGYSLLMLWSAPRYRGDVIRIVIAFLIFGSVAGQEFLELTLSWEGNAVQAIRAGAEEATELLGMLILLRVTMGHTAGLSKTPTARPRPAFDVLLQYKTPLAMAALIAAPVFALVSAGLEDFRGRPAPWLASLAFLAAALIVLRPMFTGDARVRWPAWALAGLCLLASVSMVTFGHLGTHVGSMPLAVSVSAISAGICVVWLANTGGGTRVLSATAVLGAIAVAAAVTGNHAALYLLAELAGIVVVLVHAHAVAGVHDRAVMLETAAHV